MFMESPTVYKGYNGPETWSPPGPRRELVTKYLNLNNYHDSFSPFDNLCTVLVETEMVNKSLTQVQKNKLSLPANLKKTELCKRLDG